MPKDTRPEGWEHPDNLMWQYERKLGLLFATADLIACEKADTFQGDPPMSYDVALGICGLRDDWKVLREQVNARVSEVLR